MASFGPTLAIDAAGISEGSHDGQDRSWSEGALAALDRGDGADARSAGRSLAAASDLAECDAIALAQFSLARAAPAGRSGRRASRVLTTPDSAVRKLKRLLS
jgi:hypothetical protein